MSNYKIKNKKGFTLIEILLYIVMVSSIVALFSSFLFMILESQKKHEVISEVDQEGIRVVLMISQAIRNAERINLPIQGTSGETLSLEISDSMKNPTIFNSSGTNIQIKEGLGPIIPLASSRIEVSSLSFHNVSRDLTPGIVKFSFDLTHINPSGRNEYDYSKIFYGSASLRYN